MQFNNLNSLFGYIEDSVKETLKEDVAETVKENMAEEIQANVYNAYSPLYYKRRGSQGGLGDKSNMEAKVDGSTLTVKNITPLDNGRTDWELDEIVCKGYGNMPFARDFCGGTKERLEENGDHIEALKYGLKKRGIDSK